jgi:1-acyl-sn-glycerol-3-phosphate acyltransferase
MTKHTRHPKLRYPRRRVIRSVLRGLDHLLFALLADLEVTGQQNLPKEGPLLVVINHFSFVDPAVAVRVTPYPIEVVAGFQNPAAPFWGSWILKLWGHFPVYRGMSSVGALRAAEDILAQGGVLGIVPEGGAWAKVLRPPRPGTAFLAARTGVPLLPIGIDGATEISSRLRKGQRARVTVRIGEPFGPFRTTGRGRERRQELDHIGHQIMRRIAELIPPERRGYCSDDPAIREAAKGTEIWPWADEPER